MNRFVIGALALLLPCACGTEYRIGEREGLKPVKGDARANVGGLTCGEPIQADGYTVVSEVVGEDCRFRFDQDIVLATPADYEQIQGLDTLANLVKAVEVEVRSLSVVDESTGETLSLDTRVKDLMLSVNGQAVLTKADIAMLPLWVRLEGTALDSLRSQIDARQTATVHVTAVAVVTQPFPEQLAVHYEVQPIIVLGAR